MRKEFSGKLFLFVIFLTLHVGAFFVNEPDSTYFKEDCLFCKIATKQIPAYIFWEDDKHMAFLTPYPNTVGASVVITKTHKHSYAFALNDSDLTQLILASKKVGMIIDEKLEGIGRTGLVLEGFGIDHAHAKLFPMHGTVAESKNWKPIKSKENRFFELYEGFISSHDCNKLSKEEIVKTLEKLKS